MSDWGVQADGAAVVGDHAVGLLSVEKRPEGLPGEVGVEMVQGEAVEDAVVGVHVLDVDAVGR